MPDSAGRPKGSRSRYNLTVKDICRKFKCNPVEELLRLQDSVHTVVDKDGNPWEVGISPELKAKIYNDLLPYIHPKLTAVQVSGSLTHTVEADQEIKEMISKVFCHE